MVTGKLHDVLTLPRTVTRPSYPLILSEHASSTHLCASGLVSVVVQSLSPVRRFATPRAAARQAPLSFTISQSLLKLMSTESVVPSSHLILCRLLLIPP